MISIKEAYKIFLKLKPNHYLENAEHTNEWFYFRFGGHVLLSWAGNHIPPNDEPTSILVNKNDGTIKHLNFLEDDCFCDDHTDVWMEDDTIFSPEDQMEIINLDDLNKEIIINMSEEELKFVRQGKYGDYMKQLYKEIRK